MAMQPAAKQRLLIVITKSNFGGAQRYVYDLARSLKDRYDIVVACGGEGLMKKRLEETDIKTISIPYLGKNINPFKDLLMFFWLGKLFRQIRPDVVHVNSSKIGGAGAFVGRLMGVPRIVFTAHAWAFNEERSSLSKAAIKFFHWLTVALSHRTIAVSEAVMRQMGHLPLMARRMTVVHLGLDSFEPLPRLEAQAKLGLKSPGLAIGTIAELHPVKGLEYALDAVRTLPFDYSYTIIGEGDLKSKLQSRINTEPSLKKHVSLAGFVADAARYASAFDVFLLPSLSEAFGYVLLEAGLCGTAVIGTAVGGIPEVIEDMRSGILIHARKPKEIARALQFLHDNPETRADLAKRLNDKVKTRFSLESMVEQTIAVYRA